MLAKSDIIDRSLLVANFLTAAMISIVLIRYPSGGAHLKLGLVAIALVSLTAIAIMICGRAEFNTVTDKLTGSWLGGITGILWVFEIGFNNFADPRISTGRARFFVDNCFWAIIALAILAASFARAWKSRRIGAGVRVGLWSGYISGTMACLMAFFLILFGMRFLQRDPINISEYAARASGAPPTGMAAYFAYETMAGGMGHLFVLGIGMGLVLGLLGGLVGKALGEVTGASSK
jgi:hypothetical protein